MLPPEPSCEMWQKGEDAKHPGKPLSCPIIPGLVTFKLVALPLQPGVVGPYPV
jgi:hypothetical protein